MGGGIAAEMALLLSPKLAGTVLINSVRIDAGKPELSIVDPTAVPPAGRSALAFTVPNNSPSERRRRKRRL